MLRLFSRTLPSVLALVLFLQSFFAMAQGADQNSTVLDEVAAVVNNRLITRGEMLDRAASMQRQLELQKKPLPARPDLLSEALEQLILENLQVQEAIDTGLTISDAELDAIIRQIAERNQISVENLRKEIEREQSFAKYREALRKEIQITRLRDREVISKTKVFDSEVDSYLAEYVTKGGGMPEKLRLEQLRVPLPASASASVIAQAQQRAQEVLKKWRAGEDPKALATNGVEYEDLGLRDVTRLPLPFVGAVSGLSEGQIVSQPVKSPSGWYNLRVVERHAATGVEAVKLPQLHLRHIVLRLSKEISETEARRRLSSLYERIRNGSDFTTLARQYSQDASAAQGGDLGWVFAYDVPVEFLRSLDRLSAGQMTEPLLFQNAMFLIQLLGKREVEVTPEQQREFAKNALRERKNDQALRDWLRQLRQTATIDYRVNRLK